MPGWGKKRIVILIVILIGTRQTLGIELRSCGTTCLASKNKGFTKWDLKKGVLVGEVHMGADRSPDIHIPGYFEL